MSLWYLQSRFIIGIGWRIINNNLIKLCAFIEGGQIWSDLAIETGNISCNLFIDVVTGKCSKEGSPMYQVSI